MLKQQYRLISTCVFLVDLALTFLAFKLAFLLRDDFFPIWFPRHFDMGLHPFVLYRKILVPVMVIWSYFLWSFRLYHSHRTHTLIREIGEVIRVVVTSTLVLLGLIFVLKWDFVSRPWLVLFASLDILFLTLEKILVRSAARMVRKKGFNYRNLLIVGDGPMAVKLADLIRGHPHWGYRFLGHVSDGPEPLASPHLGNLDDLPDILTGQVVDDVFFVVNRRKLEDLRDALLISQELGINTKVALHTIPTLGGRVFLEEIDHTPLLTITRTPSSLHALIMKRLIDLMVSFIFLILLIPVWIIVPLLIKITSSGPVFFRQIRIGLNGRKFILYKFRTMVRDADKCLEDVRHLNEADGPVFKSSRDPRITPLGKILRKFSLDELPQFWNVMLGSMSLVGPRPHMPWEVEKYERWQRRRLSMKPGITCLWQISGRYGNDFDKWMDMDLEYIDNWSLELDFKILLKTIPAVLSGRGAR